MKTIPSHLPPVPPGYAYLGVGGEFKVPPDGEGFDGQYIPVDETSWLSPSTPLAGNAPTIHYCAPLDSEIVRLNTPSAPSGVDPVEMVLTPILRTDEASAEAYLRWLASSNYKHSLDDDPCDCPNINSHVAPHLRDRAGECMTALGYNRAWSIFSP